MVTVHYREEPYRGHQIVDFYDGRPSFLLQYKLGIDCLGPILGRSPKLP